MSIGSRIKDRRQALGYTQPQLADMLKVSKGTVGNYECDISAPNEKVLYRLFSALRCDANYLYQDDLPAGSVTRLTGEELERLEKYRALDGHGKKVSDYVLEEEYARCVRDTFRTERPVIELRRSYYKVSAGRGVDLDSGDAWETITVEDTPENRRADFALTIKGNSMEPVYSDGDTVLVRRQEEIELGQTGIFILNGAGYIKKFGGDRLISLNDEYKDILLSEYDDLRCAGKVLKKIVL